MGWHNNFHRKKIESLRRTFSTRKWNFHVRKISETKTRKFSTNFSIRIEIFTSGNETKGETSFVERISSSKRKSVHNLLKSWEEFPLVDIWGAWYALGPELGEIRHRKEFKSKSKILGKNWFQILNQKSFLQRDLKSKIQNLFTRLRSRRVVMCSVVVYVRSFVCSFVRSFPHTTAGI